MRMDIVANEGLRLKIWNQFRSASRDRVIPASGSGAALQRIKISQALPAEGVTTGVAISLEARVVRESAESERVQRLERLAQPRLTGLTKHVFVNLVSVTANPSATDSREELFVVANAPFDGFITEFSLYQLSIGNGQGFAIRTSSGQTVFTSRDFTATSPFLIGVAPDFARSNLVSVFQEPLIMRNLRVPIFAGEDLIVAYSEPPSFLAGQSLLQGSIGLEGVGGGSTSASVTASSIRALADINAQATRESLSQQARLALEQERTRRVQIEQAAVTDRLNIAVRAKSVALRAPAPPPPPRVSRPPAAPPEGAGKTFVSAWNPSFGSIGYLIPDPPRGGKVNVFDNTYTIWDISGRNVGQGAIIPVASDADIPPGARISAVRGGVAPTGLTPASGPGSTQF